MGGKRKRGAKEPSSSGLGTHKKAKSDVESNVPPAVTKPTLDKNPFVDEPTGNNRRREAALYDLLGSEDENDRIQAADCIVSSLLGGDGVSEAVLQRHLDRRLFRGLASGRNASRIGFSLVITEILTQLFGQGQDGSLGSKYSGLTFDKILGLLVDKTQAVGNIPGQEERDHYFGQLFGIECFVRAQILFANPSRWNSVLDLLLKLGNKKIWLRPQCGWVLVQALRQMGEEEANATLSKLEGAGLAKTPEGVAAWLVALERYPSLEMKPWHNPLSRKSLGDLATVLKESFSHSASESGGISASESGGIARNNGKQAGWTAQLHFVWDIILGCYVKGGPEADADGFKHFWSRVVDDGLFSRNATDGQKFKGFMVFQTTLEALADQHDKLQCLFGKNFVTSLMNQASRPDRYLHRAAIKALKAIENLVSSHPQALVPVLQNLLGKNGTYGFDQRTNTKTVHKLLQNINQHNAEGALAVIRQPIASLKQQNDEEAKAILRVYAGYLSEVLNAFASDAPGKPQSAPKRGSTFGPVLQDLSDLAYGQPKDIPQGALTGQIRELCRSRIESSLAKLTRNTNDFSVFCHAVTSIGPASRTMSEEIKTAVDGASMRMKKLLNRKPKKHDESLAPALAMLHAISIFQLYNGDADAMEVLSDLTQFYDRLKTGGVGDGNEGGSEMLVEILLSMAARPSSLMRQVCQQVFDAFTGQISAQGLRLLTDPLASGESTKGQQELFNMEDDDTGTDEGGSSDDDEVSDVEMDSDVEFVGLNGDDGEAGEDEDTDDEAEGEEEGDEREGGEAEGEKQQPQDLDELVGEILKSHRLDKDGDAEESSSDGDMSDSEMLALDEKLAEVFKQRTKARPDTKKQKKDAKQSVVNFKNRILDLVDIYVKNEALNPLAFSLLVPLLELMHTTSTRPLATRACEIIIAFQKGLKKARASKAETEELEAAAIPAAEGLLALLAEVHDAAGRDKSHAYARAASAASLIVASAMFAADKQAIRQVAAVYAKTQSRWVLGEARLQNSFFADWNNWCQNHASQARS